jgi:hypothetical protein
LCGGLIALLSGCKKEYKLDEITNKGIILSLDDMFFYPEHLRDTTFKPQYKYVVYVDSADCSPCKVIRMGIWNYYRNKLLDYNVGFYMIFSPPKEQIQTLLNTHTAYKHRIPIYIDTLEVFKRDNPQITERTTDFHCFLLDDNNKILVFGDASTNHHVRDEIFQILSERQKD